MLGDVFLGSLSFFRWVAKAYQVEQCYILRLSAQRSCDGNTEGKYSYECIWTYFWLLGFLCHPAALLVSRSPSSWQHSLKVQHPLQTGHEPCEHVMVSWVDKVRRSKQRKKYTRIKKQKHTHKKKIQKRNDKVCLWNPTSTQGPIRKETSNKKRCLFGVCKGQIIKINQRNW